MDPFASTSIAVAFIAGVAALFAPCCITVLLPSYLGSIFKEKYKIVLMTFVFFLGILTIFLPIGLGVSALSAVFREYHNFIFVLGGIILVLLGISLVLGKSFVISSFISPKSSGHSVASVYILGIFSAIATTCCAPVLAGVMALSAASGSIFWGGIYTLSYVFGMVAPLFLIAIFLDKVDFTTRFGVLHKAYSLNIFGFRWKFTPTELIAGAMFLGMGIYIIYLSLENKIFVHSAYKLTTNIFIANLTESIQRFTQTVPEIIWASLIVIVFIWMVIYMISALKHRHEK